MNVYPGGRIESRANIEMPPSMLKLTNDFIQHGVLSLLYPPTSTIRSWIDADGSYSEQQRASLLDFLVLVDGGPITAPSLVRTGMDAHELDPIREKTATFGSVLASQFTSFVMESILPLYHGGQLDINPDSTLIPRKSFLDLKEVIDEGLFDFLQWVASQLDTEDAKQVISAIKNATHWDEREEAIEKLILKNGYQHKRVSIVKDKLMQLFERDLDTVISDISVNVKVGMQGALVNVLEQDREMIPGPRHLE